MEKKKKSKWTQWTDIIPLINLSLFILNVVTTEKLFGELIIKQKNLGVRIFFLV